jgi:hypothetical protein
LVRNLIPHLLVRLGYGSKLKSMVGAYRWQKGAAGRS